MSEQVEKKARKPAGARAYIVTAEDGTKRCITALEIRVASQDDLMRVLTGDIKAEPKASDKPQLDLTSRSHNDPLPKAVQP